MSDVTKPMHWTQHTNTEDVVCPYCGLKMEDDGDWHTVTKWQCDECRNTFRLDKDYSVRFTTRRIAATMPAEQPREGGGS